MTRFANFNYIHLFTFLTQVKSTLNVPSVESFDRLCNFSYSIQHKISYIYHNSFIRKNLNLKRRTNLSNETVRDLYDIIQMYNVCIFRSKSCWIVCKVKWCSNQGLEISAPKTEILCWTNKPELKPKKLKIDKQEKELTTQTKYLGLLIDDQLKWDEHITKRVAKCKNIFFACKAAIGKKWGLDKNKIMWIYKTVILPTLTYGSTVWGPYLSKKQIRNISVCTKSINLRVNILCLKPQHIIHHWKGLIE